LWIHVERKDLERAAKELVMTAFIAPPDKTGLVLNHGDFLTVKSGGTATDTMINGGFADVLPRGTADDTTINEGGRLTVFGTSTGTTINNGGIENAFGTSISTTINDGGLENVRGTSTGTTINNGGIEDVGNRGRDFLTTINNGGTENVRDGGETDNTTINAGGVENVHEFGMSTGTIINGGTENVFEGGEANNTTIKTGGIENVHEFGVANNVTFGGPQATLELANPFGLMARSTISNWHVGDVIDFLNTTVTRVFQTDASVTVRFDIGRTSLAVKYFLAGQQANTEFKLASDGHGGTDLILTPLVGVLHHEAAIHFGPGPHF
jgi:autotransporter passenger strand-loop-strand repeat protein